jgi:hypothetical protein
MPHYYITYIGEKEEKNYEEYEMNELRKFNDT